jgi:hypothetical protein
METGILYENQLHPREMAEGGLAPEENAIF